MTRKFASHDATAGQARAVRGHGEAAIPGLSARAPAVATFVVLAALCCVSAARADSGTPPPATTPTSTTPDAPPPDPYKPPAKSAPAPKQTRPTVVHTAPVYRAPVRTYTPPASVAPAVRAATPQHTSRPRPAKTVHKRKVRVVHHHVAPKPKPVKVTFNPFANFVATSSLLASAEDTSDRARYLWLAGFAFAALALAGLSLQMLAMRTVE